MVKRCAICGAENNKRHRVDFHHYYPKPYRKRKDMRGEYICQEFHRWIHKFYSNEELATQFHDYDSLIELNELYRDSI